MDELKKVGKFEEVQLEWLRGNGKTIFLKVNGPITREDVEVLNSSDISICLILPNTKGQDREIISGLGANVSISLVGGQDYLNKAKYQKTKIFEKTLISPRELDVVIKKMEAIERRIPYFWTDEQKAMFVYKFLVENYCILNNDLMRWHRSNNKDLPFGSLKMFCQVSNIMDTISLPLMYKEILDRIGIECSFQQGTSKYAWNILHFKSYGLAVDISAEILGCIDGVCKFEHFANEENGEFYKSKAHRLGIFDKDEKKYGLRYYSRKEIKEDVNVVETAKEEFLESLIIDRDRKFAITVLEESKGYYHLAVTNGKNIRMLYVDCDLLNRESKWFSLLKHCSVENIIEALTFNNGFMGEICESLSVDREIYSREDGTCLLVEKTKNSLQEGKINEYFVYDVDTDSTGFTQLRKRRIISETPLTNIRDIEKLMIAEDLLSEERIEEAIEGYNGYIGYIGKDGAQYDKTFIRVDLNILENVEVQ